ncbi:msf transporter [Grosmannia clavigera kw1407]|uniref:Msf transporter n=1 Tax=Grosmannia clavigera (strain kw1407 / UAMH 11150) TaxID=655863 RepID=F0X747_GROCL|nr:msf transporter [Grosmannia clavigera kw1407]EFX06205.1 msf transporter [Grosmannia clavigera kw1407]
MSAATERQPLLRDNSGSSSVAVSASPSPTLVAAALGECGGFNDDEGITSVDPRIGFNPSGDPDNPRDWPEAFKWGIVMLLAAMAFTVTFTCISIVPLAAHIVEELDGLSGDSRNAPSSSGSTASVLLVTIWELGEAAGPLAIAPLSETASWGRYAVLNAATLLFVGATAAAAMAKSTSLFIAARGLTGLAVATNVLGPAIIGDLFPPAQRGSAMAIVQMAPLLGGAVGPAIGGAVAGTWGWRSVLWLSAVLASTCAVLFLVAFRETYPPAVLRRRRLRLELTDGKLTTASLESGALLTTTLLDPTMSTPASSVSGLRHMRDAVLRPAVVMTNSIVLALLSLFGAVVFSYFYTMSVSLPHILETRYGLSSAGTGSAFLAFSLGAAISVMICNQTLDRVYVYLTKKSGKPHGRPEFRLPMTIACGLVLPGAVASYGWCAELHGPLPVMLGTVVLLGTSLPLSFIPLASYVVDAFGLYAASAMTGLIVSRCLCGTFLPLTVVPLVDALGYGWGFTALASVSLLLVPLPLLVMRHGEKWRQRSEYTRNA